MFRPALLLLLFAATATLTAAPLEIVKHHQSNYVITYPPDAPQGVRQAARDLQHYINLATQAKLPIVRPAEVRNRPAFRLGFRQQKIHDSFAIAVQNRDIYISGRDTPGNPENYYRLPPSVGTWFGVCDFLEKNLQIRWFFPGKLGEYVLPRADLVIDDQLNYQEVPAMEMRRMCYNTNPEQTPAERREVALWIRRNRGGMAHGWNASHCWLWHLSGKKYYKQHPDWFALVGNKRITTNMDGHGLQICTTNPEALDQLARNLIDDRRGRDPDTMISLTPNDGAGFCECPRCRALDNGRRSDGSPIMTDRIVTYCNEMARRIKKELPDQLMGLYAYSFYADCVGKVKLDPAVRIMEVLNDTGIIYYNPERRQAHLKNLSAWKKRVNKLFFYAFPEGMGGLSLPCFHYQVIVNLFANLYQAGVTGFEINNRSSYGASGLNNYFYLRFAWRQPADTAKFLRDNFEMCYGRPALPILLKYYATLEERYKNLANSKVNENLALGYVVRFPQVLTDITPHLAEKFLPALERARQKTTNPGQRARLDMVINNLKYAQNCTELYHLGRKLTSGRSFTTQEVLRADRLAQERQKMLRTMTRLPDNLSIKGVTRTEKLYSLPFDRHIFAFVLNQKIRQKTTASYRTQAPQLDGKLTEAFWQDIPAVRVDNNKNDARKFAVGSQLQFAVTATDFYVGIKCEEPQMKRLNDQYTQAQHPLWNENSIYLFLDPTASGKNYYQMIFNSLGAVRSFHYRDKTDPGTPTDLQAQVKVYRGANFWSAEVRIPLQKLTDPADCQGDVWGINVCRTRRTVQPNEYSCWSPTFDQFNVPERFGLVIIK